MFYWPVSWFGITLKNQNIVNVGGEVAIIRLFLFIIDVLIQVNENLSLNIEISLNMCIHGLKVVKAGDKSEGFMGMIADRHDGW